MERNIYSSSNKVIGKCVFFDDKIIIENKSKNKLIIYDEDIIAASGKKEYDYEVIKKLWDKYTCTIGEIACIFDVLYYKANKWVKKDSGLDINKKGRRNSSKDHTFPKERLLNMSKSQVGKTVCNNGVREIAVMPGNDIPEGFSKGRLPFSEEMKDKLREIITHKKETGEMLSPRDVAITGWERGKFSHVDFKRGIAGYMFSIKNNKKIFFRSLLELKYMLTLEEDDSVLFYKYEPFRIKCENGSNYTPDILINGTKVIELKSYKYIFSQGGKILENFLYKKEQGEIYCRDNGYTFSVVYDIDIGFDCARFKNELKNNLDIIEKYEIKFNDPSRVFGHKK